MAESIPWGKSPGTRAVRTVLLLAGGGTSRTAKPWNGGEVPR
jgi:hypothetical protein